jgi:hypothetical protein
VDTLDAPLVMIVVAGVEIEVLIIGPDVGAPVVFRFVLKVPSVSGVWVLGGGRI